MERRNRSSYVKVMPDSRIDSKLEGKIVWENLRQWLEFDGNGGRKHMNWTLTRPNQQHDLD